MSYEVPLASLPAFELVKADEGGVVLEQRQVDQSASSGGTQLPPLVYTLEPVGGSMLRVRLGRKGRDGVLEYGLKRELAEGKLKGLKVRLRPSFEPFSSPALTHRCWPHSPPLTQSDENDSKTLTFSLSGNVTCTLSFSTCPALTVLDSVGRILHSDFPAKPYTWHPAPDGREGGLQWYSTTRMEDIMLGLGEKAAPVNIARRRWELRATNAAHYDAFSECNPGRSSARSLLTSLVDRVQTRILSTSSFPSCSSCPTLSTPIDSASRELVSPLLPSLAAKGSRLDLTYPLISRPRRPSSFGHRHLHSLQRCRRLGSRLRAQ